jgi:hypothetical protein
VVVIDAHALLRRWRFAAGDEAFAERLGRSLGVQL